MPSIKPSKCIVAQHGTTTENESVEQRRVVGCMVSEAPNLLFSEVGSSVRVDFVLAVAFFHEFFALRMVVGSVLGVRCFSCLIAFLRWPMGHMQPEQELTGYRMQVSNAFAMIAYWAGCLA